MISEILFQIDIYNVHPEFSYLILIIYQEVNLNVTKHLTIQLEIGLELSTTRFL